MMRLALEEARLALFRGDRPIGAVIVHGDKIIARNSNRYMTDRSQIAHAELNALTDCSSYLFEHGPECVIYSTCEPCVMCLGAIVMANIQSIVFGMPDNYIQPKIALDSIEYIRTRIRVYVGGILEEECIDLFRRFSERETSLLMGTHMADMQKKKPEQALNKLSFELSQLR